MKKLQWMCAALAAAVCSGLSIQASASSHSEAPGTASDPEIDNADTWAWVDGNDLIIVATYNGLQAPFAAPNWKKFADNALYEMHISRGDSTNSDLVYRFEFTTNPYPVGDPAAKDIDDVIGGKEFFAQISGGGAFAQTYTVTKIENGEATEVLSDVPVAPPNVGPSTDGLAFAIPGCENIVGAPCDRTDYEAHFVGTGGAANVLRDLPGVDGQVFAGPRDDAFYVDLGGVFDLARLRFLGNPFGSGARSSTDYTNVMAIAIKLDVGSALGTAVTGTGDTSTTVGVWATASRRKVRILRVDGTEDNFGPWRQVSRLGLPLINEAVIGLQDKDFFNRLTPADDLIYFAGYFLNPTIVRDANFLGYYGSVLSACLGVGPYTTVEDIAFGPGNAGRTDIVGVVNLAGSAGTHEFTNIGDMLRVDLAQDDGVFPNGRELLTVGALPFLTDPDVTDVELSLLLCPGPLEGAGVAAVSDGVDGSEEPNNPQFPYLAAPWESFSASPFAGPQ